MPRIRSLLVVMAALAAGLSGGVALAHGAHKAEHGGVVRIVGELVMELVVQADGVELYLKEEADEVPSAGLGGTIVVTSEGQRAEGKLVPAGGNRLVAKGLKVPPGSRVAVQVTLEDGVSKVGTNFAIK